MNSLLSYQRTYSGERERKYTLRGRKTTILGGGYGDDVLLMFVSNSAQCHHRIIKLADGVDNSFVADFRPRLPGVVGIGLAP